MIDPINDASHSTPRPVVIASLELDVFDLVSSIADLKVSGFLDPTTDSSNSLGLPIYSPDSVFGELKKDCSNLGLVLASDDSDLRRRLWIEYEDSVTTVVSHESHVSAWCQIGTGTIVQHGVRIMPLARVGIGCKINVGAFIHHEATLGDFCTLAPGAIALGRTVVESGAYVGAGAIIRQRCRVGAGATVGAGAVVVTDVPSGAVVVGVPAKRRLA